MRDMEQTSELAAHHEKVDHAPTALWKLLAIVALPVALIVDWVGVQLYLDGLRQRAYPSPRAPALGDIQLVWSGIALYLATILFACAMAMLLPNVLRRAVRTLGWLLGAGLVSLVLMVPGTYVWMARTAPVEGSIVEPGGDPWEEPGESFDAASPPDDRF